MRGDESTNSVIARARQMADSGHSAQALKLCQERSAQDPSEVSLWNLLAELQAESGHRQEALASYYRAAQLLFEKGGGERAIATYKGVLATHPQDVDANLCLAALHRQQGQLNRAALAYETAAQALAARGRTHAALVVARMIIDMSPDHVARRLRLAEQYVRADLIAEAVREFEAASAYLEGAGRSDEAARVVERLRAIKGRQPSAAPAARRPSTDPRAPHRAPSTQEEDAASLIAEADSFLRLGLIDKATDHLSAALSRNPFLRRLRDALIRLYVAQGKTKQAIAEIWALLAQCHDPQEEFRYLRYILRLDSQDQAARRQLDRLLAESPASAERRTDTVPVLSMTRVESELRSALVGHRPPTDLAVTSVGETAPLDPNGQPAPEEAGSPDTLSNISTKRLSALAGDEEGGTAPQPPTSATTRPDVDQVEAIAAEIAMSSRTFREELAEVEKCVRQGNYVDALHHLHVLAASYPHSNVVWAQLDEIERAQRKPGAAAETQPPVPQSSLSVSTEIGSALRSLKAPGSEPSQMTPTLGTLLFGAKEDPDTALEVDPADITEERSNPGVPARPAGHRPPPLLRPPVKHGPPPLLPQRGQAAGGASAAFKNGVLLRARRQFEEAIIELERALVDPALSTRAAYLIGLCYLDNNRPSQAISWFMRGVNSPHATEPELSELFYALGQAHEQDRDAKEAILYFQLALGPTGRFRDAAQRMAALQQTFRRV